MDERTLPEGRNPMLEEDAAPPYELLVERRCLGQTELKVKPGQVGTTNATKPDNLGTLDYAHLRVPLPKDLTSSGIFTKPRNSKWPEAYFLMRRSTDGFISATGMFKAAFPWAKVEEEQAEKDYIKGLDTTSSEEVAGNVWIHPDQALDLADEYGIRMWIAALLDPEPITHGTSDPNKYIESPPAYRKTEMLNGAGTDKQPGKKVDGRRSTRAQKSESPTKKMPARKIATPRKPRKGRGKSVEPESVNGDAQLQETVKVEVETEAHPTASGDEEIEHTKVNIEMPMGHPDLDIPDDAEGMLAKAREMVAEAEKIGGPSTLKGKRKAVEMIDSDDEEAIGSAPTKRARKAELELRKERLRRKTLTGIATTLAFGALLPVVMTAFGFK
ncbi:hypothetical protein LTR37_003344 [Vermiconidia calcicola]|uniref:Uncharacterized protein n=1 Tax=Vermiconidia calcicola TaxID=1690605 RepID=A0ACC3NQH5_9PEZI|nr:hypothetical protein LTR37_003344 [Vermiconidia calcicola]